MPIAQDAQVHDSCSTSWAQACRQFSPYYVTCRLTSDKFFPYKLRSLCSTLLCLLLKGIISLAMVITFCSYVVYSGLSFETFSSLKCIQHTFFILDELGFYATVGYPDWNLSLFPQSIVVNTGLGPEIRSGLFHIIFFVTIQTLLVLSRQIVRYVDQSPSRTALKERSARRRGHYKHSTQQTQETNLHTFRAIRTRNPSNKAATDRTATGTGLHNP